MSDLKNLLTDPPVALTSAERKVVRALLDDFPLAGLGSMARLSATAGVSEPSVMRLVKKLGYGGYSEFQKKLVHEVDERLRSPRLQLDKQHYGHPVPEAWDNYLVGAGKLIEDARHLISAPDIQTLAKLLTMPANRLWLQGGRYSQVLAGYLHAHLRLLRGDCHLLSEVDAIESVIDLGPKDVLILFDYRRYQTQAATLAQIVKAQGARLVLFTDIYDSPIRAKADLIISAPVDSPSPFDSLVPAMAQVEALVSCLSLSTDPNLSERLARIDANRALFRVHLIEYE
jgi:DNA-binding MurR/RpiR family transcriptional regulator|tara:strand:- start:132 stop:989 length:858 start_codon:yes stop_codon:yes gene_type:complete